MSEELQLKSCPRCWKNVYVIRAHGCKFIRCDCGIQSSRYGEHITDRSMVADWNRRPIEDARAARIAELAAERDRLREALQGLMQAVDGCLTPHEALLWKKCEEALKGSEK